MVRRRDFCWPKAMPSLPPVHRPQGATPKRIRSWQSDPRTTTQRGYGWVWQQARQIVLLEEPLCRFCAEEGRTTAAEEVDHIDGNSHNNGRDNLRPLCRLCHLQRTARDQAFGKFQWRPEWLKPSLVPLTIVCGPPASGKTTYVASNAGANDLVIDLDVIASRLSGQPMHSWDVQRWLGPAMRQRNEMLGDLARQSVWPEAWLILSEARAKHREWWADTLKDARD